MKLMGMLMILSSAAHAQQSENENRWGLDYQSAMSTGERTGRSTPTDAAEVITTLDGEPITGGEVADGQSEPGSPQRSLPSWARKGRVGVTDEPRRDLDEAAGRKSAVPAAASAPLALEFESAVGAYEPYAVEARTGWKAANDQVGRVGGWMAYARQVYEANKLKEQQKTALGAANDSGESNP